MSALGAIAWFVALLINILVIFHFVGLSGLVNMFPEGRRWWLLPSQLMSLATFAIICIYHPF